MKRMILIALVWFQAHPQESITGLDFPYREICQKALRDPYYFQNFRSLTEYAHALEIGGADLFASYLTHFSSRRILEKLEQFRKLDAYGNPETQEYPIIGKFSGTTLRYIVIADQIHKLFNLPIDAKIVEIGAGFGGQCYILSQIQPYSTYIIFDLPEVAALIDKMMQALAVKNVTSLSFEMPLPENKIDLVVSNYAYSECDRNMQMDYFKKIIQYSDRGYFIYNQISENSMTANEFMRLLEESGITPYSFNEIIETYSGNLLIIWDRLN